jgi:hypothetical protein
VDQIEAKLEELADLKQTADSARRDYEAKRNAILRVVEKELGDLEAEFQPLIEASGPRISTLEQEIKDAVLQHGASVKGTRLSAVFSKGRTTWDREELDGYAKDHPEILRFQQVGKPSVTLRDLKSKNES